MTLYLMRHAEAVDLDAADVEHDTDRPLSEKGKRQADRVGRLLKRLDVSLDVVLTSPLVRARESAKKVLRAMDAQVNIKELSVLAPESGGDAIWKAIRAENAENILIVGHLPSIASLARALLGSLSEQPLRFHKSSVAALRCEGSSHAPHVALEWMLTPAAIKRLVPRRTEEAAESDGSRHGTH